eukprot:12397451-Alexandrium_andersonii.AAC.1
MAEPHSGSDVVSCCAVVSMCERRGHWLPALELPCPNGRGGTSRRAWSLAVLPRARAERAASGRPRTSCCTPWP